MKQKHVTLDAVEITVLDEADHMADLGFLPGVTRIMNATPTDGQRLLFSATLDNGVDKLVRQFLHNPVTHSVDEANSPVAAMTHHVFTVDGVDTKKELIHALASGTSRRILFMRTKHHAKKLAQQLIAAGIPAVDLHGNLSQPQRDRNLAAFGAGDVKVLVATDVAARGVHVDDVELVVHVDPPMEHKAYLHRSGRTARAGSEGDVVTLVLPAQEKDVAQLLRKAGIQVGMQRVTKNSDAVVALVGDVAPYVKPALRQPQRSRRAADAARARTPSASARPATARVPADSTSRGERSRRDRSGRPPRHPARRAPARRAPAAATSTARAPAPARLSASRSYSAPSGNARRPNRRSGRPVG